MYKKTICIVVLLAVFILGIIVDRFSACLLPLKIRREMTRQSHIVKTFAEEQNDPQLLFYAAQFSKLTKTAGTSGLWVTASNTGDIYTITSSKGNCEIASEVREIDEDSTELLTRTYCFQEGDNRIVCSFTRNAATRQLIRCYYNFNNQISYIDTDSDGIWDMGPINTDKLLNVGSELPIKDQLIPISPSKPESNPEK